MLPLDRVLGDHDWIEIGAALGAWVGTAADWKVRAEREQAKDVILSALKQALEADHAEAEADAA